MRFSNNFLGVVATSALIASFLIDGGISADAQETTVTPVVGSFNVGAGVSGGVNERTGEFDMQVPLVSLPELVGEDGVKIGVSYHQSSATAGMDRFGMGVGWGWSEGSFVDTDGDARVFPASGEVFEADESQPSGLQRYTLGDLVFSQVSGVLPARNTGGTVNFAYELEYLGGVKEYFSQAGDIVARVGTFGSRTDWVWDTNHRLMGVISNNGISINIEWGTDGFDLVSSSRSDGSVAVTQVEIEGNRLVSVTNPIDESVSFVYDPHTSLVRKIVSTNDACTEVSYQELSDKKTAVREVSVVDSGTGNLLSTRQWKSSGEHTFSGWPLYEGQSVLWASGDGTYRYQTVLSDGPTDVVSEYNSLGLLVSRRLVASTSVGDVVVKEQEFTFPGTEERGVPDPAALPRQYTKPTRTSMVFHDNTGRSRTVTETTRYNERGQIIRYVSGDGTITEMAYDTQIPEGMALPRGLVLEETKTGRDGAVSHTVNALDPDRKTIAATETFVATPGNKPSSPSRTETTVDSDGFVSEKRVISTNTNTEGPKKVVTGFNRHIDDEKKTMTLTQTDAVGTPAQSSTQTVVDLVTGLPVSTTDATGRVAFTTYDMIGRVVTQTDYTGFSQRVKKTEYGNKVTRVTDPQGVTQSEYVNVLGLIVKVTDNIRMVDNILTTVPGFERTIETRKYEQNSSKVTVTDGQGRKTVSIFDMFGRPIRLTSPSGTTQVNEYDDVANTTTTGLVSTPDAALSDASRVTTTRKDDRNREVTTVSSRKDEVQVPEKTNTFDGLGRVVGQTTGDVSTTMTLNSDGTPKTTTMTPTRPHEFAGETVTADREYDMRGVATKKTLTGADSGKSHDGVSNIFDAAGRIVQQTDQTGHSIINEYTVDGLLSATHNEATGVTTHKTYDPRTRMLRETEVTNTEGKSSRTQFEYNPITDKLTNVFDPADRTNTRITYTYDLYGNPTSTTYPDGKSIHHYFDEYGRKTSTTDVIDNVTKYEYNTTGLCVGVTQNAPDGNTVASVTYRYDPFGRMVELSRDNGVKTVYTFTSADEIKTETTTHNNVTVFEGHYTYDGHGNLTQQTRTHLGTSPSPDSSASTEARETTTYGYNAFNQLTTSSVYPGATAEGTPTKHVGYEIDISGNVTKETTTTLTNKTPHNTIVENTPQDTFEISVREYEYNTLDQLLAITTNGNREEQQYDAAGNLTRTSEGTQYTYNPYNQPATTTTSDGAVTTTTYWATGQQQATTTHTNLTTTTSTEETGFYWDATTLINDTHATRTQVNTPIESRATDTISPSPVTRTASYLIGTTRHTRSIDEAPGNVHHYVTDRHGSTVALTDRHGDTTTTYEYTDYGKTTVYPSSDDEEGSAITNRNPFQYASEYTAFDGTQNLGKRMYIPEVMGFTTKDNADQFNLYAYAHANPITKTDPTGQSPLSDVVGNGILAGLGVVMSSLGFAAAMSAGAALQDTIFFFISWVSNSVTAFLQATNNILKVTPGKKGFMTDSSSKKMGWSAFGLGFLALLQGGGALGVKCFTEVQKSQYVKVSASNVVDDFLPKSSSLPKNFHPAVKEWVDSPNARTTNTYLNRMTDAELREVNKSFSTHFEEIRTEELVSIAQFNLFLAKKGITRFEEKIKKFTLTPQARNIIDAYNKASLYLIKQGIKSKSPDTFRETIRSNIKEIENLFQAHENSISVLEKISAISNLTTSS